MKYLFYIILLITTNVNAREFWSLPLKDAVPYGLKSNDVTLWVSDFENKIIYRFDQRNAETVALPFPPARCRGLALSEEIFNGDLTQVLYFATSKKIYRLNGSTGKILSRFSSPEGAPVTDFQGLALGQGGLWVTSRDPDDDCVYRDELETKAYSGSIDATGTNFRGLCFHDNFLWNVDSSNDLLYRISPHDGSIIDSFQVPFTSSARGLTLSQRRFYLSELSLQTDISFQIIAGNTTEVYIGKIYDADGKISFTEHIDDKASIRVDGIPVLEDDNWRNRKSTQNLNLAPGWHDIEIRISNGNGGSGPVFSPGIGFDPAGGTNWRTLVDTGDCSLLRAGGRSNDPKHTSQ